ncbi:unnamed protein product, partial [Mesorhabditis spiculigera]
MLYALQPGAAWGWSFIKRQHASFRARNFRNRQTWHEPDVFDEDVVPITPIGRVYFLLTLMMAAATPAWFGSPRRTPATPTRIRRTSSCSLYDDYPRTPKALLPTPKVTVVLTPEGRLTYWFRDKVFERMTISSATCSVIATFLVFLASLLMQFSLLHPLQAICDVFWTICSWKIWVVLLMVTVSNFAAIRFGLCRLAHAQQRRVLFLWNRANWWYSIFFSMIAISNTMTIMGIAQYEVAGAYSKLLLYSTILFGSIYSVFSTDHQLRIDEARNYTGANLYRHLFSIKRKSIAQQAFFSALIIHRNIYIVSLIFGLPVFGPSIFSSLIWLKLHAVAISGLFISLLILQISVFLIRRQCTQPMTFPLPPLYAVDHPSEAEERTLTAMAECKEPFLKMIAFDDLRNMANDQARRKQVYALSQPGGFPRTWQRVSGCCFAVLRHIQKAIEEASRGFLAPDEQLDDENIVREMFAMPAGLRNQAYMTDMRKRVTRATLRPQQMIRAQENPFSSCMSTATYKKYFAWLRSEEMLLSRSDCSVCMSALEALCQLSINAVYEDDFGIVQNDFAEIISVITGLMSAIDCYFRVRNIRPCPTGPDAPLINLQQSLKQNFKELYMEFGTHINKLVNNDAVLDRLLK